MILGLEPDECLGRREADERDQADPDTGRIDGIGGRSRAGDHRKQGNDEETGELFHGIRLGSH